MDKSLFVVLAILLSMTTSGVAQPTDPLAGFSNLDPTTDWPWWRGPNRNGIASNNAQVPSRFGNGENLLWKTPVPGRGHSSPIVVGGTVFLATADEASDTQSILAYNLQNGRQLWTREISQGGFPANNHPKNTEASTTLASNGELVFVTFFHHEQVQLTAFRVDGQPVWQATVAPFNPKKYEYGYSASPVLHKNLVIIATEYDGASYLTAFDAKGGDVAWRVPRPRNITFSSPVIADVAGRTQLLISGSDQVCAYDPNNGRLLWTVPGTTSATCGTMVWSDDLVFASGGYPKAETIAIVADGSRRIAWRNKQKCYEQSMIFVDGYLYGLTDQGIAYCWRGGDGVEMWRHRLAGPVSASPVLAGGNIYWANEKGTHFVFRANPQHFQLVSENRVGDESFASPAISGNRLLLRVAEGRPPSRQEYLICIGRGP